MSETTIEGTSPVRTFWPTDYRRFAGIVRGVRKDRGDEAAEALRSAIIEQLTADSPEFNVDMFKAGTGPVMPAHVAALAKALKQARHVKCQPTTAKADEHQAKVDAMAVTLAGYMTDVPGFDPDTFVTGTKLAAPDYGYSGEFGPDTDEDDDPDEDSKF